MASALSVGQRSDMFYLDPSLHLAIVTPSKHPLAFNIDRVDPSHPVCEEAERDISEDEIASIEARGILQPIRATRDGTELAIVVLGRRRVRMARIINERREAHNKKHPDDVKPLMTVPTVLIKGDALSLRGAMLAENMLRRDYSPMQVVRALSAYVTLGATPAMCASVTGREAFYVTSHLAVLETAPEIQRAVEGGTCSVTAAAKLADLPRAEQVAALEKLTPGERMTLQNAKRAVKHVRHGDSADPTPSKKEVSHMIALLQIKEGDLTPTQRETAIEILEWVRNGKRPKSLKLPRINTPIPKEEKAEA